MVYDVVFEQLGPPEAIRGVLTTVWSSFAIGQASRTAVVAKTHQNGSIPCFKLSANCRRLCCTQITFLSAFSFAFVPSTYGGSPNQVWDFYLFWGDPALHHFVVLAFVIGNAEVILKVILLP